MKIGITGHQEREGIDWPWVRSQIDRYLAGKSKLVGYSSLAAGSDQIFAEAILDKGGKLIAVIPMADYSGHFHGSDLQRFNELLARSQIIELASIKFDERAFLDAGKWISREADRIIAVWDGEPAEGTGGTGDVVAYALSLGKAVHHIDPFTRIVADR